MARKSRKNGSPEAVINLSPIIRAETALPTALYARLSVNKDEKESLQTQITLVRNFIESQPDLMLADIYADNGFSGTSFERPEFTRLMNDVRSGGIRCIVVKDLSRFGRNFLEVGYYLEMVLPQLKVRFIAVNDDYDSSRETDRESIAVPIKNMVNALYAKDFSKKQAAYFELHSRRGDAKILRSSYGYTLDRENNRLLPNDKTAPIVQMIFCWYLRGATMGEICNRLNAMCIPTPAAYKALNEENKPVPENDRWKHDRIKSILSNHTYTGDTVHGKRRKVLYRNEPEHKTSPEEWIDHKDTHTPLVTHMDFEMVQTMIAERGEAQRQRVKNAQTCREQDLFSKKVQCAECGRTMYYTRCDKNNSRTAFYQCIRHGKCGCGQKISADLIHVAVMDQMHMLLQTADKYEKLLSQTDNAENPLIIAQKHQGKLLQRLVKAEETNAALYENYANGILTAEEYREMKEHYAKERKALSEAVHNAEEKTQELKKLLVRLKKQEADLKNRLENKELQDAMLKEMVDVIFVHSEGKLEIHLICEDIFASIPRNETENVI